MSSGLRNFLWIHFLSKLKIGRSVEAQLRRDMDSAQMNAGARPARLKFGSATPVNTSGPVEATYLPDTFDAPDIEEAKRIILTRQTGTTTNERWELETPYLVDDIGRTLALDANACVLDYGCGIGRVAKGLIERYGCSVIGVDISANMRRFALQYVESDRFSVCSPELLDIMIARGFRATHAYAVWVIQHCENPDADLARIESALTSRGSLYVLNADVRAIPSDFGWVSDGVSVPELLARRFDKVAQGSLPQSATTEEIARRSFTMTLRKRA